MNATPLLSRLLAACAAENLEVVLIGNAAAALHGAPVTTLDFDFMFRDTPTNMRKLKRVAAALGGMILRPYYPVSRLYRLVHDASGLQADFMPVIHGVRSFEGLKARAVSRDMDGETILVASLGDIIASKRAANREQDRAVFGRPCQTTETHIAMAKKRQPRNKLRTKAGSPRPAPPRSDVDRDATLNALSAESREQLRDLIRRRLALPIEQRMNFLRRRMPGGGTCL